MLGCKGRRVQVWFAANTVSSSCMVEVQPWCFLVKTMDLGISEMVEIVCRLAYLGLGFQIPICDLVTMVWGGVARAMCYEGPLIKEGIGSWGGFGGDSLARGSALDRGKEWGENADIARREVVLSTKVESSPSMSVWPWHMEEILVPACVAYSHQGRGNILSRELEEHYSLGVYDEDESRVSPYLSLWR